MKADYILFIFCLTIYIWQVSGFCLKYLYNPRINKTVFAGIILGIKIFANVIAPQAGTPYILNAITGHIMFILLVFAAFREDRRKKLFVPVILILADILVWNFSCSLVSCFILTGMEIAGEIEVISIQTGNIIGSVSYCAAAFVINILLKRSSRIFHNKTGNWYMDLSVPLAFLIIIADIINWGASNGVMLAADAGREREFDIYYSQLSGHAGTCLFMALFMCIVAGFVSGMDKIYTSQKQKEQYLSEIEFYKMLNEQYLQMERLRHDMKNHVLSLYGLWKNKEYKKTGDYLEKMMESGNIGAEDYTTGNKVIDVLLYNKSRRAKQDNICMECDVQIPGGCTVDEFDMCVLFGNILDNAINACNEAQGAAHSFIYIQSHKVKDCFLLVSRNTTILKDIKEIKQGTGFLNIKETVKKYNGTASAKIENNVFEIAILVPMDNNAYNIKQAV